MPRSVSERVQFGVNGICLCCGEETGPYRPHEKRYCCAHNIPGDVLTKLGEKASIFPTVYPNLPVANLTIPDPQSSPIYDVLAVDAKVWAKSRPTKSLPFLPPTTSATLKNTGCGNAIIADLGHKAQSFGFATGNILVCDMSSYRWSQTLKDPRSWAAVHFALANNVRTLGVWTAGNAGTSLARMAFAVNRGLRREEQLRVFCYGIHDELPVELQWEMAKWGAQVFYFKSFVNTHVIDPESVVQRLKGQNVPISLKDYWDVSDGWDGVGLSMYRLLGRQLCTSSYKPKWIVLPIGTGDLFYGIWLGLQDAIKQKKIRKHDCRILGVVPDGTGSVLENYRAIGQSFDSRCRPPTMGSSEAVAPKLATTYTPLLFAMYQALISDDVQLVRVSKEEQISAARILLAPNAPHPWIAAEPCAMLTFGGLWNLATVIKDQLGDVKANDGQVRKEKVIVISTGCGVLGPAEREFIKNILPPPVHA